MNKAQKLINRIMMDNGLRHKYQVAEFFGVTPQAISTWLTKGEVPSKHQLKVRNDIESLPFSRNSINCTVHRLNCTFRCGQTVANLAFFAIEKGPGFYEIDRNRRVTDMKTNEIKFLEKSRKAYFRRLVIHQWSN